MHFQVLYMLSWLYVMEQEIQKFRSVGTQELELKQRMKIAEINILHRKGKVHLNYK